MSRQQRGRGQEAQREDHPGSRWLQQALVQADWAASHEKDNYFQAHARNLMHRRGRKRGLFAVAHSLLIIVYHMLKEGTRYRDLGPHFLDRLRREHPPYLLLGPSSAGDVGKWSSLPCVLAISYSFGSAAMSRPDCFAAPPLHRFMAFAHRRPPPLHFHPF